VNVTVIMSRVAVRHDHLLKLLFHLAALRLPLVSNPKTFSPVERDNLKVDSAR